MNNFGEILKNYISIYGISIVSALLVLVIGLWVSKLVTNAVNKLLTKRNVDSTLVKFITSLVKIALYAFVIIAAISKAGIETTSFIAVLGAAGLAVGLALQGSLSNFASGVMLIIFRPFKVGDYIQGSGLEGIVEEIGIFVTKLNTLDNKLVIIPNSKLTSDSIVNFTAYDKRRVDMVFGISYKENIDQAKLLISEVLDNDLKILKDPKPDILVSELGNSSVNFVVRPWCKTEDYWSVYFDVTENIKKKFDEHKIEIPLPQRVVHLYNKQN